MRGQSGHISRLTDTPRENREQRGLTSLQQALGLQSFLTEGRVQLIRLGKSLD